ncbi:MAG TPA: hypothetical protein VN704_00580, partial [Verrucomicrobiae bacterium]|nr:hypothetical protein [Verrucomicrobiae bacterium]
MEIEDELEIKEDFILEDEFEEKKVENGEKIDHRKNSISNIFAEILELSRIKINNPVDKFFVEYKIEALISELFIYIESFWEVMAWDKDI